MSRSPNWASEGPHEGTTNQMIGRPGGDVSDYNYKKVDNSEFSGNHTLDSPRSGPRSIDLNAHAKAPADMENSFRYSEMGPQSNDVFLTQKDNKANRVGSGGGLSRLFRLLHRQLIILINIKV